MKLKKYLALSFLSLPIASSAGCGSSDDDNAGGITASQFAESYCALLKPCCLEAGLPAAEQASCKFFFGTVPVRDGVAAEKCLADYQERAQSAMFCDTVLTADRPASCESAFYSNEPTPGTAQPGESCTVDSDCAPSTRGDVRCNPSQGGGQTCQVKLHAAAGDPCVGEVFESGATLTTGDAPGPEAKFCYRADGVYCDQGVCRAISDTGGPCSSTDGCSDADYCDEGTCAPRLGVGSPCPGSSRACDEASYCAFPDDVCVARVGKGEPCSTNEQCLTSFCYDTCDEPNVGGLALAAFCG